LSFENSGKIAVEVGDAVVIPYAAGAFTVNNCAGILSRPPAA
jgi:mannose-6-phosphate isomerase